MALAVVVCMASAARAQEDIDITVRGRGYARFEAPAPGALARIERADGGVYVLRPGNALWMPAVAGSALEPGAAVRTGPDASALLRLQNNSAVYLGPESSAAVDLVENPQGETVTAVGLETGKLWATVARTENGERVYVSAGDGIFDSAGGRVFVEIDDTRRACADVFAGALDVRAAAAPTEAVRLQSGERTELNPGEKPAAPKPFQAQVNENDHNYSCLTPPARKTKSTPLVMDGGEGKDIVISNSAIVSFSYDAPTGESYKIEFTIEQSPGAASVERDVIVSANTTVVFTSGGEENIEETTDDSGTLVFTAEQSVDEGEEEPEYEEINISVSALVTFVAEDEACETAPRVTSVSVDGSGASAGGSADVVSNTCAPAAIEISGTASAECGDVNKVTVTAGSDALSVSGKDDWSATFTTDDETSVPVRITVSDSFGNESDAFEFDLNFTRDVPPPEVSVETVAGLSADGISDRADIYRNMLENGKLVITGAASSETCDLDRVEVSTDNGSTWAQAQDAAAWTYEFTPSDGDYDILARAFDELDNQSGDMFQAVAITYNTKTEEDNLREIFEAMIQAYKDRNTSNFMEYTASSYSSRYDSIEDYNSLDNSLDNKFAANPTLYLRHKIDQITVSGQEGRVAFQWDADSSTSGYSQYATFIYAKESGAWQFETVEDDNTFLRYTSVAGTMELTSGKTTLIADETDNTTITATIRDTANNLIRDGTVVTFTTTTGSITSSATTSGGAATVTFTAGSAIGTATITATTGDLSGTITLTLQPERAPPPPE